MIILDLDVEELAERISGFIQGGLVTSVEALVELVSLRSLKSILQSTELSWMREPERGQRLRGLNR